MLDPAGGSGPRSSSDSDRGSSGMARDDQQQRRAARARRRRRNARASRQSAPNRGRATAAAGLGRVQRRTSTSPHVTRRHESAGSISGASARPKSGRSGSACAASAARRCIAGRQVQREAARRRLDQHVTARLQRRGRRAQIRGVHGRVGAARRADRERARLVRAQQPAGERDVAEARLDQQRRRRDDDARRRERQPRRQAGRRRRRVIRRRAAGGTGGLRVRAETGTRAVVRLH